MMKDSLTMKLISLWVFFMYPQCTQAQSSTGHFLSYGLHEGDTQIDISRGTLAKIEIDTPLVLYQRAWSSIYVSSRGLMSPDSRVIDITGTPTNFPRTQLPSIPLIALLWTDIFGGTLYYRATNESSTLKLMRDKLIGLNSNFSKYQPKLTVIVTFSSVAITSSNKLWSFQAVLSTDGNATFAFFSYDDPTGILTLISQNSGFDAGDQIRSVVTNPRRSGLQQNELNFRIDGNCVTGIQDDNVCRLNSLSTGCTEDRIVATESCLCYPGVQQSRDSSCLNSTDFTCPIDEAVHMPCSSEYPDCVFKKNLCNGIVNCLGGVDELPSLCGSVSTLLPFGTKLGDQEITFTEALTVGPFNLEVPIVYYLQREQELYISTNGLLSFKRGFSGSNIHLSPTPLIVPLWVESVKGGSLYIKIVNDPSTLEIVKAKIMMQDSELDTYQPILAVIISWEYLVHEALANSMVIFQVILSTDGTVSFSTFNYGDIDIVTTLSALTGFYAGDQIRSVQTQNISSSESYRIDGHCITSVSMDDICNLNSFAVGCELLSASACRCYESSESNNDNSCQVNATFTCLPGFIPSICPQEEFLGCFPAQLVCNLASDCPNGIDESNCTSSDFIEFGVGAGDTIGPYGDDVSTSVINLAIPVVFFEQEETLLYISTNGLISFRDEFTAHDRSFFLNSVLPVPIISPLWFNYDLSTTGSIYYKMTEEPSLLEEVRAMIVNRNLQLNDYYPKLAIIVTWFDISLRGGFFEDSPLRSTFQAVISTDGRVSFAAFIYSNLVGLSPARYFVGFDAGVDAIDNIINSSLLLSIENVNIFRIDGGCVTTGQPGEVCGLNARAAQCNASLTRCLCDGDLRYQENSCLDLVVDESNLIGKVLSSIIPTLFIAGLALSLGICALWRYKKISRKTLRSENQQQDEDDVEDNNIENEYIRRLRQMSLDMISVTPDIPTSLLINSCNLQIGKTIGQGEFGIVYQGYLKERFDREFTEKVALKTLKGFFDNGLASDLMKECDNMRYLNHPNVLTLIGVCLDGGPAPYIVMPFMANGSLLSYLRNERKSVVLDSDAENLFDVQKMLLGYCMQVAKGMEYLISQRIVHRDLAARNCMIDANFLIKVADFGLSVHMDTSKEYFRQNQDVSIKLPVKWMAPESITDGKFSEKTDVWAYGVTIWEIFSGGKIPYPGVHPMELSEQLETGYRMMKPLNAACPNKIYQLMKTCWENDSVLRPSFLRLVQSLSSLLESMAEYLDLNPSLCSKEEANSAHPIHRV